MEGGADGLPARRGPGALGHRVAGAVQQVQQDEHDVVQLLGVALGVVDDLVPDLDHLRQWCVVRPQAYYSLTLGGGGGGCGGGGAGGSFRPMFQTLPQEITDGLHATHVIHVKKR